MLQHLPTKVNLVKRKLLTDTLSSQCKLELEDTFHAIWSSQLWPRFEKLNLQL